MKVKVLMSISKLKAAGFAEQVFVAKVAGLERVGLCKVFYWKDRVRNQHSMAQDFVSPGWMSPWGAGFLHQRVSFAGWAALWVPS